MIKIILWLAMCIPTLALSQHTGKYATFSAQKKSIVLSTGITMKYIDTGNPAGTPVMLLHGSTDTGRSFQLTLEELTQLNKNFRVIIPDLRGHGETSMPDKTRCADAPEHCFTPTAFAADIIDLINQLHLSKVHLVGHSMGSIIAQELAIHHTDRVNSIILIGTFVNGKECQAIHGFLKTELVEGRLKAALQKQKNFRWPTDAYGVTPKELGPEVTGFIKENWVTEIATEEAYLEAIYQETIQVPIGTWIGMFAALGQVDNRETMANVKVPVLVLNASQDVLLLEIDQAQVKAALKKASQTHGTKAIYKTYGKIPLQASDVQDNDLGHNLQWAAPKQVAADISSFINNGYPVADISYVNPNNPKQVLTETIPLNIIDFRHKK